MPHFTFSVVIPTYNRPERLQDCLGALAALQGPDFEVVVVDDGSPQPAAPICDGMAGRLNIRCFRQENAGPGAARNRGVAEAAGTYIAFTDDDCRPRPDWLANLLSTLQDAPEALVGGRTINGLSGNSCSAASQDLSNFLYDYRDFWGEGGAAVDFFPTLNVGCAKRAFEAVGGFDTNFYLTAEDRNLGMRWKASGRPLKRSPEAVVEHYHQLDLFSFAKQHFNYGRGARFIREYTAQHQGEDVPFEGLRFYRRLLRYPLMVGGPKARMRSVLVTMSQAIMIAGFAAETIDRMRGRRATSAGVFSPVDAASDQTRSTR